MMRALLFLSLVGAAIYGFLVVTEDALTDSKSKNGVAAATEAQADIGCLKPNPRPNLC
jgi:hypothetical protein